MPTIKNITTTKLTTIRPDQTLLEAAKMMASNDIGFLPVVDNHTVRGVLTDRDIIVKGIAPQKDMKMKVEQLMTKNPCCIECNKSIEDAARMMRDRQVRRLIVTENNKFMGVISLGDLARSTHGKGNEKCVSDALHGISQQRVGAQ